MTPVQLREKAEEHAREAECLLQYHTVPRLDKTEDFIEAAIHASLANYYLLLAADIYNTTNFWSSP